METKKYEGEINIVRAEPKALERFRIAVRVTLVENCSTVNLDQIHQVLWSVAAGVINAYDRRNMFYYDLLTGRRLDQLPRAGLPPGRPLDYSPMSQ